MVRGSAIIFWENGQHTFYPELEAGVFTAKSTRLFQGYAQELQAEMNQELLETIHQTELDDWGRFRKIREAEEKRLHDPDDVFIHARERKEQIAKEHRKTKHKK